MTPLQVGTSTLRTSRGGIRRIMAARDRTDHRMSGTARVLVEMSGVVDIVRP
jgi:hypothetical protein